MADNVKNNENKGEKKETLLVAVKKWAEKHPRLRKAVKIVGYGAAAAAVGLGGLAGVDMISRGKKDYILLDKKRMTESPVVVDTTATIEETNEAEG